MNTTLLLFVFFSLSILIVSGTIYLAVLDQQPSKTYKRNLVEGVCFGMIFVLFLSVVFYAIIPNNIFLFTGAFCIIIAFIMNPESILSINSTWHDSFQIGLYGSKKHNIIATKIVVCIVIPIIIYLFFFHKYMFSIQFILQKLRELYT